MASPRVAAERLISELGLLTPAELDVELIASFLGAEVRERPVEGCAATIVGVGGRAIINVDPSNTLARRRFSIAHELGHWIYDRERVAAGCTAETIEQGGGRSQVERRADKFASELLMPVAMMQELLRAVPSIQSAKQCAATFCVSLTAATIRLVELSEHPVLLVCSTSDGKRLWYNRGSALPDDLRPRREIRSDSHRVGLPGLPGREKEGFVSADVWIDDELAYEFELHESSITVSASKALSVLTWPDEAQIEEWLERG